MKISLNTMTKWLEVYYDGRCGMCSSFVEWLVVQERAFEVQCVAYQSDEAARMFPELDTLNPDKEIIVRVDGEAVYRGAEGWVWCLWSCAKYRDVAQLVNSRLLLPMATKVCYLISRNRFRLSKLVFGRKSMELERELHDVVAEVRREEL